MTDRPILFSGPMVSALLAGTKTQTRRNIKPQPRSHCETSHPGRCSGDFTNDYGVACPYGKPGDRLWVREAWRVKSALDQWSGSELNKNGRAEGPDGLEIRYEADAAGRAPTFGRYRHARFMPRWASRITLEIVGVRVERLHDATEADAIDEGVEKNAHSDGSWSEDDGYLDYINLAKDGEGFPVETARDSYATLWELINGAGSWELNPWVWVVEFRRVQP